MVRRLGQFAMLLLGATFVSGCSGTFGSLGSSGVGSLGGSSPQIIVNEGQLPANATAGSPPPARKLTQARRFRTGLLRHQGPVAGADFQPDEVLSTAAPDALGLLRLRPADRVCGIIATGDCRPPSGPAYRAAVSMQNFELTAPEPKVALVARFGPASGQTIRAIGNASLEPAGQSRLRASYL